MTQLLTYLIPGIPYGCLYALVAIALVLTYKTSGVFNLALGAQAYVSASIFYAAVRNGGLSKWEAFVLAVLVAGPLLGFLFDRLLFRFIQAGSWAAQLVTSLGLLIAIPALVQFIWPGTHYAPPSASPNPDAVYNFGNYYVDGNQMAIMIGTVAAVMLFGLLFRFTALGLRMRAVVESPRLMELLGIRSSRVSSVAWMISGALTALAGVLLSPIFSSLDSANFTSLLVAAIAGAAVGGLTSIPLALVGGLFLGVAQQVLTGYLPLNSILATGLRPSLPFVVLILLLLFWPPLRRPHEVADPLAGIDPPRPSLAASTRGDVLGRISGMAFPIFLILYMAVALFALNAHWLFLVTQGSVYAIIFLSITLLTGIGGEISLCQMSFAGIAAFTAGQMAMYYDVPFLPGMLISAGVAAAAGALVAIPALRLRGLYLSLATLAFALLADNVLFPQRWVGNGTTGVKVPRPQIGSINLSSNKTFFLMVMAIFAICAFIVVRVRKGTVGRYLTALRGSEVAAVSIGINSTRVKITVFALSAGIAGIGGALFGSLQGTTGPQDYSFTFSLVFVAVLLLTGPRTVDGALTAGLALILVPEILGLLPQRFGVLTYFLFGYGAILYAKHPEGVLEYDKRRSQEWLARKLHLARA